MRELVKEERGARIIGEARTESRISKKWNKKLGLIMKDGWKSACAKERLLAYQKCSVCKNIQKSQCNMMMCKVYGVGPAMVHMSAYTKSKE